MHRVDNILESLHYKYKVGGSEMLIISFLLVLVVDVTRTTVRIYFEDSTVLY